MFLSLASTVLLLLPLVGCRQDDGDLCTDPASEEVATLCAIDQAAVLANAGQVEEALAVCQTVPEGRWRGECSFQVSEAMSLQGDLVGALALCSQASTFAQMCQGHVLWLNSEHLVDRGPSDTDVQALVDDVVAAMPDGGLAGVGLGGVARAAAWHGVYAGSGDSDPTAARQATGEHAPYARGAFAWEVTRLMGAEVPADQLVAQVWAIWQGGRAPVTGPPSPVHCWDVRLIPRASVNSPHYDAAIRTYGGDLRFVDDDPQTDLLIATISAVYAHGGTVSPEYLRSLTQLDSSGLRSQVARLVGAAPTAFSDLSAVYPEQEHERKLARITRRAALATHDLRPFVPPGRETCP